MLLRYALGLEKEALAVESAIAGALGAGHRTADIAVVSERKLGTQEMTAAIIEMLKAEF
jgi:3-isopropylmalate dehydrogenase